MKLTPSSPTEHTFNQGNPAVSIPAKEQTEYNREARLSRLTLYAISGGNLGGASGLQVEISNDGGSNWMPVGTAVASGDIGSGVVMLDGSQVIHPDFDVRVNAPSADGTTDVDAVIAAEYEN